jgi:hypothetical protein
VPSIILGSSGNSVVLSITLGSSENSDSSMLASTQTVERSARVNRTSFISAFWLGTAALVMIVPSKGAVIW